MFWRSLAPPSPPRPSAPYNSGWKAALPTKSIFGSQTAVLHEGTLGWFAVVLGLGGDAVVLPTAPVSVLQAAEARRRRGDLLDAPWANMPDGHKKGSLGVGGALLQPEID